MNINQIMAVVYAGMAIQVAIATPTVSDVVARQRYPWNGMVDIDYTITGDASGCVAEITVEDRQGGKTYTPTKFLSVLPTTEGRHRVTWSTEAEGVTIISTNVAVTVALVTPGSSEGEDDLCYVIDLSGGPTAARYPVTTMRASPTTVWSDEYKTTKLVLRRIKAGDIPTHDGCRITQPFYIGVFEVTVAQWELVMSSLANPTATDKRAKGGVSYDNIRGDSLGAGWPSSPAVDATSFLGKLRNKTSVAFDLPTDAQWEYACRAGTTSKYNNGGDSEADLQALGRYSGNQNDGRGGYSGSWTATTVGSYAPNAWGLYDMHGNVWEWCLDWASDEGLFTGDDPAGPTTAMNGHSGRLFRGGSFNESAGYSASSNHFMLTSTGYPDVGFRLVCPTGL